MTYVLAAIDNSACARAVLAASRPFAALFEAVPVALHVREDGVGAAADATRVAGLELRHATGEVVDALVDAAAAPDVAALILGSRGTPGGARPVGRTAIDVITRVGTPVVVVSPDAAVPSRLERVLIPLEGSSETSAALSRIVDIALRAGLEVTVLHVHEPELVPAFADQLQHEAPAWSREFAARFVPAPRGHVTIVHRSGASATHVLAVAAKTGADLIALGWGQDLSPGRAAVVREVLAGSGVPVLLVPTAR